MIVVNIRFGPVDREASPFSRGTVQPGKLLPDCVFRRCDLLGLGFAYTTFGNFPSQIPDSITLDILMGRDGQFRTETETIAYAVHIYLWQVSLFEVHHIEGPRLRFSFQKPGCLDK